MKGATSKNRVDRRDLGIIAVLETQSTKDRYMATKKSRLDGALERFAIKLLKEADCSNNRARTATANTLADGTNAAPTTSDSGPTLTERTKVFAAVVQFRQIQARLEPDEPIEPGSGTLEGLRSALNGPATGGRASGAAPTNGGRA